MKNPIEQKNIPSSVLDEDDFKDMIENRKIDPVDFAIIEQLSRFPKNLFIDYHNYFGFSRQNTLRDLQRDLNNCKDKLEKTKDSEGIGLLEDRISFLGLFIEFAQKYDWCACDNLNRVFERRKIEK